MGSFQKREGRALCTLKEQYRLVIGMQSGEGRGSLSNLQLRLPFFLPASLSLITSRSGSFNRELPNGLCVSLSSPLCQINLLVAQDL